VTAKPKRKPRKVVVWAVVGDDWHEAYASRKVARSMCDKTCRVVRCEGVLR
jgi:hypothetical protein